MFYGAAVYNCIVPVMIFTIYWKVQIALYGGLGRPVIIEGFQAGGPQGTADSLDAHLGFGVGFLKDFFILPGGEHHGLVADGQGAACNRESLGLFFQKPD